MYLQDTTDDGIFYSMGWISKVGLRCWMDDILHGWMNEGDFITFLVSLFFFRLRSLSYGLYMDLHTYEFHGRKSFQWIIYETRGPTTVTTQLSLFSYAIIHDLFRAPIALSALIDLYKTVQFIVFKYFGTSVSAVCVTVGSDIEPRDFSLDDITLKY